MAMEVANWLWMDSAREPSKPAAYASWCRIDAFQEQFSTFVHQSHLSTRACGSNSSVITDFAEGRPLGEVSSSVLSRPRLIVSFIMFGMFGT